MKTLYVVRHAIAEVRDADRWPDDSERPLTTKGEERFRRAAQGLRVLVAGVDAVLSSTYVRAWRTAEILDEEAGWPAPQPCPELEADRAPDDALTPIREQEDGAVALVGHEPHLSGLISLLVTGNANALVLDLKKGGVVCLELGDRAILKWAATPKMLRRF